VALLRGPASTADMSTQAKPDLAHRTRRLTKKRRHASATVHVGGKDKFPIPDKAHARSALARIDQAKPALTPSQKARVRSRARIMLGKNATAGDGRLERPAPGERNANIASAGTSSGDRRTRTEDSFFDSPVYRGESGNQMMRDLGLTMLPHSRSRKRKRRMDY
jgi:hypothetical protein